MTSSSNDLPQLTAVATQTVSGKRSENLRLWLPLIFAATAYLTLIARMDRLLWDADTYWHIVVGQWIIEHRAVPHFDMFSFTMHGAPWITSAWLAEVLYFASFKLAGWPGPAILAALSSAATFFLLAFLLLKRLQNVPVAIMVGAGIAMLTQHTLARPHVLVFPLTVLWVHGLLQATEERRAPSLAYLPVITLWANLHGSFTLGLALIVPFAIETFWINKSARLTTALRWLRFGLLSLGACCITPYGAESILVTIRILKLGAVLSNIAEWKSLDFGTINPITVCFFGGMAYFLYSGLKLPPVRIAVLLGLIYETFAHIRYVDTFALVVPFILAGPLGHHVAGMELYYNRNVIPLPRKASVAVIAAFAVVTGVIVAATDRTLPLVPQIAVEKLREFKADRVLNDYYFCGYLIFHGVPTFVDSRAELYGSNFLIRYMRAISLQDVPDFVRLLDEYKIDSTLLMPSTQAVGLLDMLPEWKRVYADDVAVVHVRRTLLENASSSK
ncbi:MULTISPECIES: hypothetical protein [unclassified Bradyrhizobium]